ncbi:response regulator transcription factor [Microbacterium sp. B2969]|uniref:Response regulator transcription factor n=1 Tax=Microbacterium alkaliflavum TaxID=3248839 RepID=A0ABW7QH74_9MICO
MKSVLIVEDDPEMGQVLERGIAARDYAPTLVTDGVEALIQVSRQQFAAAVIDVMLPGMSGFEICRRIRESGSTLPVLLLTARDGIDDRVFGLDSGADDYLTKPFSFDELAARLRALMRRDAPEQWSLVSFGDVSLDAQSRRARVGERQLSLSPNEFLLLKLLISQPDRVVTRPEILDAVWGSPYVDQNIVDQYVSTLRKKLAAGSSRVAIVTIRGVGYQVEAGA